MSKKIEVDREELYQKYIVENMARKDCAKFFHVSEKAITRRLSEYGIKRNTKQTYLNRKKAMLEKYGCEYARQIPEMKEKAKRTMLERYGVEYTAQSPELQKKMQDTMLKKYNKKNYVETTSFQDKSKETCLKKYGVEHPCQFPQCIDALYNSIGHSKPEEDFVSLLKEYGIEYEREYPLRGFKYDFKVGNYLLEINPTGTHNSTHGLFGHKPKNKNYHFIKQSVAKDFNMHCVHIFDWDDPRKVIKTFLSPKERIFARNCELKEVSKQEAVEFLEENHLQGYAQDEIRLGLYYKNELVEIMTFAKPRYNSNYDFEIVRLCAIKNVIGGSEKLLKNFIKLYKPTSIISYCDLSKFDGKVYRKLGFVAKNKPKPSKHWVNMKNNMHITDNLLRQRGFDQLFKTDYGKGTSNEQLMLENGFLEVYDCGQIAYVLSIPE